MAAVAATWLAHVGDELSSQLAQKAPAESQATATQVTRTRIITSILDADPTVVGSIPRPAAKSPADELRR
jgi:hypothetical protein